MPATERSFRPVDLSVGLYGCQVREALPWREDHWSAQRVPSPPAPLPWRGRGGTISLARAPGLPLWTRHDSPPLPPAAGGRGVGGGGPPATKRRSPLRDELDTRRQAAGDLGAAPE